MINKKFSFEYAVNELESIIQDLESGEKTLEQSLELFTKGTTIVAMCKEKLKSAECKIRELTDSEGEEENGSR